MSNEHAALQAMVRKHEAQWARDQETITYLRHSVAELREACEPKQLTFTKHGLAMPSF